MVPLVLGNAHLPRPPRRLRRVGDGLDNPHLSLHRPRTSPLGVRAVLMGRARSFPRKEDIVFRQDSRIRFRVLQWVALRRARGYWLPSCLARMEHAQ